MTREEAIKVLETERAWIKTLYEVSNLIVTAYKASFIEAFDMAIEALRERPKGRWIELPCEIGTKLYKVTHPYRQPAKVTEFTVKNFRTVGKRHRIQIEVQATNVPATNWMYFSDFYATKEEADLIEANYLWQGPPPLMRKVIKFLRFVIKFLGIAMLVTALCGVWTMK